MSKLFLELRDRIVTDTGEVVAKPELLLKLARDPAPLNTMRVLNDPLDKLGIERRNRIKPLEDQIGLYQEDDIEGPPSSSYEWNIPEKYQNLDLVGKCFDALNELDLMNEKYIDRLEYELEEMSRREMFGFLRAIVYVIDQFREKDVVWGVGRGSSCASLVLYLLGVNKVDPVLYDIPIEEFLKPEKQDG
jgi:DNA polymerase III alpha subunit